LDTVVDPTGHVDTASRESGPRHVRPGNIGPLTNVQLTP